MNAKFSVFTIDESAHWREAARLLRGEIVRHYATCALWSSLDDGGKPLNASHDEHDIAAETLQCMRDDCAAFFFAHRRTMRAASGTRHLRRWNGRGWSPAAQHAYDYWLTRNRHGAGFWDRGYGDAGRALTSAAHACGSVDLYVGDDGKVQA